MREFATIEVFQDLLISSQDRNALRNGLLEVSDAPWSRDEEAESRLFSREASEEERMLAFRRDADNEVDGAILFLWPDGSSSYKVSNIVPRVKHALTEREYNAVLQDFIGTVVEQLELPLGAVVQTSSAEQSPLDWTSRDAAEALQLFSLAANKSNAASHPLDRERWMAFIVEEHKSKDTRMAPSLLARWLHSAESWPEDVAQILASDFESSLELLEFYDEHR